MKRKSNSRRWEQAARYGWVVAMVGVFVGVIGYYGDNIGLPTVRMKYLGIISLAATLILICYGKTLRDSVSHYYRPMKAIQDNRLPPNEERIAQTSGYSTMVIALRQTMSKRYGYQWSSKIQILLVMGTVSEVEHLSPGLTTQFWQEDRKTVLLWGGDSKTPVDTAWLKALRKLCYRPVDGLVWVTPVFDTLPAPDKQQPPLSSLDDRAIHTLSSAIHISQEGLGWQLPLYVWLLHRRTGAVDEESVQAAGCLFPAHCTPDDLTQQLTTLSSALISQGVQRISQHVQHNFLLRLADLLIRKPQSIVDPLSALLHSYDDSRLAGVIFSQILYRENQPASPRCYKDQYWDILIHSIDKLPIALCPRPYRTGIHWQGAIAPATALLMVLWGCWMTVSFISNRNLIIETKELVARKHESEQGLTEPLSRLVELQKRVGQLQYRTEWGTPWFARAGLNHNRVLLAALWPHYHNRARSLLSDAAAYHLATQLKAFIDLPPNNRLREQRAKTAYDHLKLYLMLSRQEHMDADWFSRVLMQQWPKWQGVTGTVWQEVAPSLLAFYGTSLIGYPQWQRVADDRLVSQVRDRLNHLMVIRNSESNLYQKILSQAVNQHADLRLEEIVNGTDATRLLTTDEQISGIFTRQAWEQTIQPAIEHLIKEQRNTIDWVLSDEPQKAQQVIPPDKLQRVLTKRYFADFSKAWLIFLNSLRWKPVSTLPDAIDQLTLMADKHQSPLLALMETVNIQGRTGLIDKTMASALPMSVKENHGKTVDLHHELYSPLGKTFEPLLALEDKAQPLSLQTYLSRVTQMRLRLQQVTNAADPQAMIRALSQGIFQGKAVDFTRLHDDVSLIVAELGDEWQTFAQEIFMRPLELAWQQILLPMADSLNARWQQVIVRDWNQTFGGRYPFSDSQSEVSLPLLAKYLQVDSGRITDFLQTHLSGVLHREGAHWIPDNGIVQGLTFNPDFLNAINLLSQISDVAFVRGEAGFCFELCPGTAPGVMQTHLVIDRQSLDYANQIPQWKRFAWPADTQAPGATLSWISTQASTRQYADIRSPWGWIRLLEKAVVSEWPSGASRYKLSWQAMDGRMINYSLRTEVGEGPLALLKLRHFRLPATIFDRASRSVKSSLHPSESEDWAEISGE